MSIVSTTIDNDMNLPKPQRLVLRQFSCKCIDPDKWEIISPKKDLRQI